jgi:hypothetical protein
MPRPSHTPVLIIVIIYLFGEAHDDIGRMRKEAIAAYFKVYPNIFYKGLRKTTNALRA